VSGAVAGRAWATTPVTPLSGLCLSVVETFNNPRSECGVARAGKPRLRRPFMEGPTGNSQPKGKPYQGGVMGRGQGGWRLRAAVTSAVVRVGNSLEREWDLFALSRRCRLLGPTPCYLRRAGRSNHYEIAS
jgi:hypothetical protein